METSGVKLEATNFSAFLADIAKANTAIASLGLSGIKAGAGMSELNRAAAQVRIENLTDKITNQKDRLEALSAQLKKTSADENASQDAIAKKQQAYNNLSSAIRANERNLDLAQKKVIALAEAEREAAKAAALGVGANKDLTNSLDRLERGFGDTAGKASKFDEIVVGGLRKIGSLGVESIVNLGQSLLTLGADSIKVAGDYEATINRFSAVAGPLNTTGQQLDDFSAKFLKLGMDTQYSAQQAGDAAVELAKGGLTTSQIMSGALDATLALAAAGELELAPAAAIVAKQLGVWKEEAGGATNVVNRLAQAANSSTVDVDDLAIGLANVGGVAKAAGLSFDETVTAVGLIAPGFSSASDAGTSFKAFLANIQPSSKPAIEAMRELGLLTENGTSKFYDAEGAFIGMSSASELLYNATNKLSDAEKSRTLRVIFGSDAQRAAIAIAEQGAKGYGEFAGSMDKQGSALDQAAKRQQGFNFAMDQFKGSIETAQIVIGTKLLPAGTALINDFLIPAVNGLMKFVENIDHFGKMALDYGVPVLYGLAAALVLYNAQLAIAAIATPGFAIGLALMTQGAIAATASFVALAAPLVIVGASIAGMGMAWNYYNREQEEAVKRAEAMSTGFQASGKALENYNSIQKDMGNMSPTIQKNLDAERANVERLRTEYSNTAMAIVSLGGDTEENNKHLQETGYALQEASARLNALTNNTRPLIDANAQNAEAMRLSREGLVNFATAADQAEGRSMALAAALRPTGEEAARLYTELDKIRETGLGLFAEATQGTVDFQAEVQTLTTDHIAKMKELQATGSAEQIAKQEESYSIQMQNLSISHAEQEAATMASLGRQLIAYTEVQGRLNGVTQESINEMTAKIADGYGVMQSETERSYGAMMGSIDQWAANGGKNSDQVVADLHSAGAAAVDTQQRMDELAKQYTAELVQNFKDGKIDADQLSEALTKIPARVNSEVRVHTSYTESGNPPTGNYKPVEARAGGGDVLPGRPYLVGERGPEYIFPRKPGWVMDADQTDRLRNPSGITGSKSDDGKISATIDKSTGRLAESISRLMTHVMDSVVGSIDRAITKGAANQAAQPAPAPTSADRIVRPPTSAAAFSRGAAAPRQGPTIQQTYSPVYHNVAPPPTQPAAVFRSMSNIPQPAGGIFG